MKLYSNADDQSTASDSYQALPILPESMDSESNMNESEDSDDHNEILDKLKISSENLQK